MPRLLRVRKKARVPAICCASVGRGSLSNRSLMLRLSALIQPVGLPSGVGLDLQPRRQRGIVRKPERLDAAGA